MEWFHAVFVALVHDACYRFLNWLVNSVCVVSVVNALRILLFSVTVVNVW